MATPESKQMKIKKAKKRLSLLAMAPRPPVKKPMPIEKKNKPVLV